MQKKLSVYILKCVLHTHTLTHTHTHRHTHTHTHTHKHTDIYIYVYYNTKHLLVFRFYVSMYYVTAVLWHYVTRCYISMKLSQYRKVTEEERIGISHKQEQSVLQNISATAFINLLLSTSHFSLMIHCFCLEWNSSPFIIKVTRNYFKCWFLFNL